MSFSEHRPASSVLAPYPRVPHPALGTPGYKVVSRASRIFPTCTHARMTSGRGNPHGKIRLGTLDRFSCPSPECWADQSDCSNALIAFHVTCITINSVSHK